MIAFLDVQYSDECCVAHSAIIMSNTWTDDVPAWQNVVNVSNVADYQPGEFFRRELPCLIAALDSAPQRPTCVVVDGYVWLDEVGRPGLGAKLHAALDGAVPVVGVAKTRFHDAPGVEILRAGSIRPLIVTASGIDQADAAEQIRTMHGAHRIPTLLKYVDQLARGHIKH